MAMLLVPMANVLIQGGPPALLRSLSIADALCRGDGRRGWDDGISWGKYPIEPDLSPCEHTGCDNALTESLAPMSEPNRPLTCWVQQLAPRASGFLALTLVALCVTSCGDTPPASTAVPAPSTTTPDVPATSTTSAQDTSTYAYAQKVEFETNMKTKLDKLNADIAELAAKIDKANDQAKADAKPKLQALRDQAAKLGDMLGKAQVATAASWDAVKADFKVGFADLEDGVTDARKWLSEKIAP
jgi:hypothetical protein